MRVLDTDTCIAILRGNAHVIARRAQLDDTVSTTWITAAELYYGAAKSKAPADNRARVTQFLSTLDVLALDAAAAQLFGEAKASLERAGQRLADADLLIAAISIAHGGVIVTGNRKHYERIPGAALEDWLR